MGRAAFFLLLLSCAPEGDLGSPELRLLSSREQLIRASVDLRGVHPSEEELVAIESDPSLYAPFVERFLDDPRFTERIRAVFNQRFLTRTSASYGQMIPGASTTQVAEAIGEEPLRLLSYIVDNDLPYAEIVLAEYTVASPLLAEIWHMDRADGEGWTLAHYTDSRPESGILTMNGVWSRYPSMGGNANRHRANAISKMLLCDDYLSRPIVLNRSAVDQLTIDPEAAISENEGCQSCHATLDPLSAHLFGFFPMTLEDNEFDGIYRPEQEGNWRHYADKQPGFYGIPTNGIPELAEHLASDPRFIDCAVQTVFEGFSQRPLLDEDWSEFQLLRDAFVDSNQSIRSVVRALVLSDSYLASGSTDPDLHARIAGIKIASPAQLSSIIADITGYQWSFNGTDGLTSLSTGLPVLLGGIDGDTVTERSYEPSVGAVFIQERLAQSAAWHVADHDLSPQRSDDAIMLAYVTHTDRPSSATEAFDAQIRALYLQATGLPLAEDADEPVALMLLWEQLYALEASPTAAWAGVLSAVLRDPRVLTY
jgi:hypothetical protein